MRKIQEIVDMASSGRSDLEISKKTGASVFAVKGIRNFYGIRHRMGIDITQEYKKILANSQIVFSSARILADMEFNPTKKYEFKVKSFDGKAKTITLVLRERE